MLNHHGKYQLTADEVTHFQEAGYIGPFSLGESTEWISKARHCIENEVLTSISPWSKNANQFRHLDQPIIFKLCSHPAIVDRVISLFGPHIILWMANLFEKEAGGLEFPWHQDINYWSALEPTLSLSAWIAIDSATPENGCVQVIPGSHKLIIPHIPVSQSQYDVRFGAQMADPAFFDVSKAVSLPCKPGEFFLFNERTLHYSGANKTQQRRLGLTARLTVPIVKIKSDIPCCILVNGEDYMGFNQLSKPPVEKEVEFSET